MRVASVHPTHIMKKKNINLNDYFQINTGRTKYKINDVSKINLI